MDSQIQSGNTVVASEPRNQDAGIDFKIAVKEALHTLSRKRKLFAIVGIVAIVLAVFDHLAYPSYTTKAYLFVESQNSNSGLKALLGSLEMFGRDLSGDEAEDHKYLLALDSADFERRFDESLKSDPGLPQVQKELVAPQNLVVATRRFLISTVRSIMPTGDGFKPKRLAVPPVKAIFLKKGVLEIQFKSASPKAAVFLTNHFLDTAVGMFSERESAKVEEAKAYLRSKIDETLKKMAMTDKDIVGMSTSNAALSLFAPQSVISERLLDQKIQIQKNELTVEQNRKIIETLKARLAKEEAIAPEASNSPPAGIPPAFDTVRSMFGVRKTISNLEAENELLAMKIASLKKSLEETIRSNLSLPKEEQKLADLKRDKGLDYFIFDNLIKTLLQVEVKGLSLLSRVYPLEKSTIEKVKVTRGLTSEVLLTLLGAMLLTAGALFALDYVNPVIRSKKDLEGLGVSHLGDVPLISDDYFQMRIGQTKVCRFNIESKETIAFKQIRTRLLHLAQHSGSKKRQVVALMSYGNSEGKSFISSNLASCFAQTGAKTLLVDFDLRRGALTKLFEKLSMPGICSYLDHGTDIDSLIYRQIMPGMDFLPAGTWKTETTEHFSNTKFLNLIDYLKQQYEYIIIDTAPMVVAHESLAIAQDSDFAIFIATAWKTRKEYIMEAIDEIRNVRKARIHILLNRTEHIKKHLVSNYYYMTSTSKAKGLVPKPVLET